MKYDMLLPVVNAVLMAVLQWTMCSASELQINAQDYCQSQMFKGECQADEVILMHVAQYGRLSMGKCIEEDFGYVGHPDCDSSVLVEMDRLCSGKHSCKLKVEDPTFPSTVPCHIDLKSFLHASYACVPVMLPSPTCEYNGGHVLTDQDGYISSHVTRETGCGLMGAPWKIQLPVGQTVNITLIDFNSGNASLMAASQRGDVTCRVYVTIRDTSSRPSKTICGEKERERLVYQSVTNVVEIRMMGGQSTKDEPEFLLRYWAVGCPEVTAPPNGWFKRTGKEVEFGCNALDRRWKLRCEGTHWVGRTDNCSTGTTPFIDKLVRDVSSLPYGTSIALVVVIAVIVGSIILTAGIFCIKYKLKRETRRAMVTAPTLPVVADSGTATKQTTAHPTSPPPHYHPGDLGSRENEYASMRLLPPTPDSLYDKQNLRNMQMGGDGLSLSTTYDSRRPARCQSPDHIYESPESDRRVSLGRQISYRTASPQYFDLDPQVITMHHGRGVPASREGNYCTCQSQQPPGGGSSSRGECNKHSV